MSNSEKVELCMLGALAIALSIMVICLSSRLVPVVILLQWPSASRPTHTMRLCAHRLCCVTAIWMAS
jgi:hypothetical protein